MNKASKTFLVWLLLFAVIGIVFSAISTYDFISHLDRQLHAISCSILPYVNRLDSTGASGCYAVMMSPYSAIFREFTWAGIPIALPSLCVFVYLLFHSIFLLLSKRYANPKEMLYLFVGSLLPLCASIFYFIISIGWVGVICQNCIGIYIASLGVFFLALMGWLASKKMLLVEEAVNSKSPEHPANAKLSTHLPWGRYTVYFLEGVVFVLIPIFLYLALKPEYTEKMGRCGQLIHPEDTYGVKIKLHRGSMGAPPAIELLDPLCPACNAFHKRLKTSGYFDKLDLDTILFPLDKTCNWMVNESVHPGACAISEAIFCAKEDAPRILEWAFIHSQEIRQSASHNIKALYQYIRSEFPSIAKCVDTPHVRAKINKSLRWIVSNSILVSTPQLYVRGQKICDEDIDLGLDFVLNRALSQRRETP